MGVTGITQNKLFKVRTLNQDNLYQIGVNGVTDVSTPSDGLSSVKYTIDDIDYTSYLPDFESGKISDFVKFKYVASNRSKFKNIDNLKTKKIFSDNRYTENIPGSNKKQITTGIINEFSNRSFKKKTTIPFLPSGGDTVYVTKNYSYDQFIISDIVKKERYVGLIDYPIVESDLFIERDEYTIFERHQRLSEINNLAALQNYRGGYFKNIKTL